MQLCFSLSRSNVVVKGLNLCFVCSDIRRMLKEDILAVQKDHPNFKPGLAIIQVGTY